MFPRLCVIPLAFACVAGCGGEIPSSSSSSSDPFSIESLPSDPNWSGTFGPDAIVGGTDIGGTPLYVCRGRWDNSIQPGKYRTDWNNCHFGYGGAEQWTSDYQVLTARWENAANGAIPGDALDLGIWANNQKVYVCRGTVAGSLHTGKIMSGFNGCYIPYGGQEQHVSSYQVLSNSIPLVAQAVSGGKLPPLALAGGRDSDGAKLYPCLAYYGDGTYAGKTRADWGSCDVSWGGGEYWVTSYSVIVPELWSAPLQFGYEPWPAGTDADGSTLGVCTVERASDPYGHLILGGTLQLGKALANGTCSYGFGAKGEVIATSGFSVMPTVCGLPHGSCCPGARCQGQTYCDGSNICQPLGGLGMACVDVGGGHKSCQPGLNCNTLTDKCEGGGSCNQVGHICCPGGCPSGSSCVGVDPGYSPGYCAANSCGTNGNACCNGSCSDGSTCVGGTCKMCGLPGQACCTGTTLLCHENDSVCLPTGKCSQSCGYSGQKCCDVNGQKYCAAGSNDCDTATGLCL